MVGSAAPTLCKDIDEHENMQLPLSQTSTDHGHSTAISYRTGVRSRTHTA